MWRDYSIWTLFWVSEYPIKTHLTTFGLSLDLVFEWSWTKVVHPNTFKVKLDWRWDVWKKSCNFWSEVTKERTRLGIRLMEYVEVRITSPQNVFDIFVINIKTQATSRRYQLSHFCWGMSTQELDGLSYDFKDNLIRYDWNISYSMYNLYLCLKLSLNHCGKVNENVSKLSFFLLIGTQQTQLWSSIN